MNNPQANQQSVLLPIKLPNMDECPLHEAICRHVQAQGLSLA